MLLRELEEKELKVIEQTKKDFFNEMDLSDKTINFYLETVNLLSEKNVELNFSRSAVFLLSYRILRYLRCAYESMIKGYYDTSMALLRISYENHLLLYYLFQNENEAKLWFSGKKFSPSFLRKNIKYSSDELYQKLSDFIHSNIEGTQFFLEYDKEKGTIFIIGEYDKKKAFSNMSYFLMTLVSTMIWFNLSFANDLYKNEQWHTHFKDTIPKLWKHIDGFLKKSNESKS